MYSLGSVIDSIGILNAVRHNDLIEAKFSISAYKHQESLNLVKPYNQLSDKGKDKFRWHTLSEDCIKDLHITVMPRGARVMDYRTLITPCLHDCDRNVNEIISALVDLYHGKEIFRRIRFSEDKESFQRQKEQQIEELKSIQSEKIIKQKEMAIRGLDKLIALPESDERYSWKKISLDRCYRQNTSCTISLSLYDYVSDYDRYDYSLKEIVEKRTGILRGPGYRGN